jgi:hypothetical protein
MTLHCRFYKFQRIVGPLGHVRKSATHATIAIDPPGDYVMLLQAVSKIGSHRYRRSRSSIDWKRELPVEAAPS